jgi:hypothetical protein
VNCTGDVGAGWTGSDMQDAVHIADRANPRAVPRRERRMFDAWW